MWFQVNVNKWNWDQQIQINIIQESAVKSVDILIINNAT